MDDKMIYDLFGPLSVQVHALSAGVKRGVERIEARLGRQGRHH